MLVCSIAALLGSASCTQSEADVIDWRYPIPIQVTRECPGLDSFDEVMTEFMGARNIPGGALAVTRDGKLVLARGYGYADVEARELVQPGSMFRIASLSKPITGVAMMRLMELHPDRISLSTPMMDLLDVEPHLPEGRQMDGRLREITVRQLLHHTAGWDRDASFDPMFRTIEIAEELGVPAPAGPRDVVSYMLGMPLDFDPGTRHVYSSFGYCVLGRIIEAVSGRTYEKFVKEQVLAPLGITRMRIGRTLPQLRAEGEVRYYDPGRGKNVMEPEAEDGAPSAYGTWRLEAMDAHGGWIASGVDLARFATAFDDPDSCPILSRGRVDMMFARPDGPAGYEDDGKPRAAYYACGWSVRPTGDGKANHWHTGSLPGTRIILVRRHDGLNWAAVFNQRRDRSGRDYSEIDGELHRGATGVTEWPEWDLFGDAP